MPRQPHISRQALALLESLLAAAPDWTHGYALMRDTGLKSGTLYPLLLRLSDDGYLELRDELSPLPGRPPRKAYRLSTSGIELARQRAVVGDSPARKGAIAT